MTTPLYRHDLDPTGLSVDNRVLREPIVLADKPVRVFVPTYGAFFGDSMSITDTATGQVLLKSQYYPSQLAQMPTSKYGKGIYYCIVITDPLVSANVNATYQLLGGEWEYSNSALADQLQLVLGDTRAVDWSMVLNKPARYGPGAHLHDVGDVYGFEYLVEAIYAIRDAISIDQSTAVMGIYQKTMDAIDALALQLQSTRTEIYQSINGLIDQINALQGLSARVAALENKLAATLPTYSITPVSSVINEGSTAAFTLTTSNISVGTLLYWTVSSNTGMTGTDFSDGAMSGTITVTGTNTTLSRAIRNDMVTDGEKRFVVQVRTASVAGTIVAASSEVVVNDTSILGSDPTYVITPSATSVNEGDTVTFTVTTTNVPDGTVLYFIAWSANTVNAADFTNWDTTGNFVINNGTGTFSKTIRNDAQTEGNETFSVLLRAGSIFGADLVESATITIHDTSLTATPTYSASPTASMVNEGDAVNIAVTTTNVPDGTTLYYSVSGVNITALDFISASLTGSFIVNSNVGSIPLNIANDAVTEGNESFVVQIRTGSASGAIVSTTTAVTITDTSTTPVIAGNSGIITSSQSFRLPATSGNSILVYATGGGGGGGGGTSRGYEYQYGGGGGGASAGFYATRYTVTPGALLTIAIGAGGTSGGSRDGPYSAGSNGGNGGATTISMNGTFIGFAPGAGGGGVSQFDGTYAAGGVTSRASEVGTLLSAGSDGTPGISNGSYQDVITDPNSGASTYQYVPSPPTATGTGGAGHDIAGNPGDIGAGGVWSQSVATTGTVYGGGGGGGSANHGDNYPSMGGAPGGTGMVYITWG